MNLRSNPGEPSAMADQDGNAPSYEAEHVHAVYDQIASHFSSTRYKPWPIVEQFLLNLPPGSIGLDVGCGNGKYLAVNRDVFIVASDRSSNLAKIASQHQPHAVAVADTLSLPHPLASFDFAISIAVIHHLSTPARRIAAVSAILETLKPISSVSGAHAKALIYVWALEQKDSRRGWDSRHKQDVMVPWVMKGTKPKSTKSRQKSSAATVDEPDEKPVGDQTFHRYYHLYRQGELENDIVEAGGRVIECGYERDNWWAIMSPRG